LTGITLSTAKYAATCLPSSNPDVPPDNNGSERELPPTATYRKVTDGFRSRRGADLFADIRSVFGTAARCGINAYQAILAILHGGSVLLAVEQIQ